MKIIIILFSLVFLSFEKVPEKKEHIRGSFYRIKIDNHTYIEHDEVGKYMILHDPQCICITWPLAEKEYYRK